MASVERQYGTLPPDKDMTLGKAPWGAFQHEQERTISFRLLCPPVDQYGKEEDSMVTSGSPRLGRRAFG